MPADVRIIGAWLTADEQPASGTVYLQRYDYIQSFALGLTANQVERTALRADGTIATVVVGADADDPNPLAKVYRAVGWVGPNRDVKGLGDFTGGGYEHLWPDSPSTDAGQQSGVMQSDGVTWLWTADSKRSNDIAFAIPNNDWVSSGVPPKLSSALNDALERLYTAFGHYNAWEAPPALRLSSPDGSTWVVTVDNDGNLQPPTPL